MKKTMAILLSILSCSAQAVITDSGSTNRAGMTVSIERKGRTATLESRGNTAKMTLPSDLHSQFMQDLEGAGPLAQLNARHCAKSVSFGSRTTITFDGQTSPDISCSGQTDPAVIALQKDVEEIMARAHAKMPSSGLPGIVAR